MLNVWTSTLKNYLEGFERRMHLAWRTFNRQQAIADVHAVGGDVTYDVFVNTPEGHKAAEVPMPRIDSAIQAIDVVHNCTTWIPEDRYKALAEFLDRHLTHPLWIAPQDSLKDGKVLPLSHEAEVWLIKNQIAKSQKTLASLNGKEREFHAWRWLILSTNQKLGPKARIPLHAKLTLNYESRLGAKPNPAVQKKKEDKLAQDNLVKQVQDLLTGSFKTILEKNSFKQVPEDSVLVKASVLTDFLDLTEKTILRLASSELEVSGDRTEINLREENAKCRLALRLHNTWQAAASGLRVSKDGQEATTIQALLSELSPVKVADLDLPKEDTPQEEGSGSPSDVTKGTTSEVEVEELHDDIPESFEKDGVTWWREDIDLMEIHQRDSFKVLKAYGVQYFSVLESGPSSPSPPTSKSAGKKPANKPVVVVPTPSQKGKGRADPPKPKPSAEAKGPVLGSSAGTGKGKQSVPHPVEETNPLRVKGEPRTKALSNAQRDELRKFFKLPGPVPPGEFSAMSPSERTKAMAERSLPRWAVTAVIKNSGNLANVLSGKLTKDNFSQLTKSRLTPSVARVPGQALEAWTKLKADFRGVPLFRDPQSAKEKAFKKRFDQLVASYGSQSCFPRPKERPDRQSGRPGSPKQQPGGELAGLIPIVKLFGELARAFKG
jgi:hypothetical protein